MHRLVSTICITLLLSAAACKPKQKKHSMPIQSVEVIKAKANNIYNTIEVSSEILSLYNVVIQPRVDGFLSSINYSDGMPIAKGDLLFTIDPSSFNINLYTAEASLESAEAEEMLAHNNYQRAVPLAAIDAISQSDLDQYRATHSAAKAAVKSAKEALNSAKLNLSYTTIASPINGIVAQTAAKEGDYVGPSTALSTLTHVSYIDTILVDINIPTSIYLANKPEQGSNSYDNATLLSDITLTVASGEEYPYKGIYDYTKKDAPESSGTVVIVVKFPNPNLVLKSGMYAKIDANIGKAIARIVVPQIAVSQNQGVNSVWIVKPDSCAELREVILGRTINNMWIIESGVKEGESVITSGQMKVHNGVKVKPIIKEV